jgi:hypothetical protein
MTDPKVIHPASQNRIDLLNHFLYRPADMLPEDPISLPGASVVRIDSGKITDWADYYDGLTARRTALAAHFTEWVEY